MVIKGKVIDAETKETLPFVNVGPKGSTRGVSSDADGQFRLVLDYYITEIRVSCVGYKTAFITLPKNTDKLLVRLTPENVVLDEVVVKPKKYRNKNNPTVELIRKVIDNRKFNRVEGFESYREEQYEKILMGVTDLPKGIRESKTFKSWRNVTENIDTTLLKGVGITPAYLQESMQDFYSQRKPKRSKIWVNATQKVLFPILDNEGLERYLRYLYQEVDIYDNYVVLLTDHFLSPISDNAPIFYRYYTVDTTESSGSKIARIQFFPRNKTDMLLQGELFIALDSTYPVTKITYTVNPNINLNWVRKLEMDQSFSKMETGKWVLSEENYILDFGATKKGIGVFAKRYVSHRNQQMGVVIEDSVFQKNYELRSIRPAAEKKDSSYWAASRHTALSLTEANTYKAMDSLYNTLLYKRIVEIIFILTSGHVRPVKGWEIGRMNTFYSFNPVEGDRIRFGFRTNPDLSKRFNVETYAAYGFKDDKWKFGAAINITLSKDRPYNRYPYNMIRINYQQDLLTPGVLLIGTFQPTSIATSFTRGTNDKFLFQKKLVLQYEKEYYNHFSFALGLEHRDLSPLGSLKFVPTDEILKDVHKVVTATPYLQLRYAPGEEFYQTSVDWRKRVRFKTISTIKYSRGVKDFLNAQYNYHDISASFYKFTNVPPIGYNYFLVEAGAIFGSVPYPLLTVHRANQTFGYRFLAYNLMNFMEFVSDQYIAISMEHNFYGFFLNKIPLFRRLKLREFATCKVLYGRISDQSKPEPGSGLYELPTLNDGRPLTYSLESKPYIEASVGIGNIFKILRVDLVRRFTYLEHPETAKFGLRVAALFQF